MDATNINSHIVLNETKPEMCNRVKKTSITITITIIFKNKNTITIKITINFQKLKFRLRLQLCNRLGNQRVID